MSIKINDLFFTLKNTNQFKLFLKEDLGALGEKISIEKSFINYFKKINKKDLNKLVYSLLNYSGIETYLTRLGDVNLRMAAVGKQHSSYISFEISNLLDLDSVRDTMENIAILCSRYDTNIIDIRGAIIVKELPNKRSDVWELLKDVKSELGIDICIIPIYALYKIVMEESSINLDLFNSVESQKSFRNSLEKNIQKKINLKKGSSLIESTK